MQQRQDDTGLSRLCKTIRPDFLPVWFLSLAQSRLDVFANVFLALPSKCVERDLKESSRLDKFQLP